LASSTVANNYSDFARTLAYTSLTTTTTRQIRLRLVGFINNRRWLLDFMKKGWQHASDYFHYSFRLHASWNQLCLAIRWQLPRLLISPTKLVGIDSD
jgi:outer membrane phospholipase A